MAKRKYREGQLGLFKPETRWTVPTELPDLRGRPLVAIDTEGKDDGLLHGKGPGWALGPMGYTAGVSWAAEGSQGYAPVRHPDTENFAPENVWRWLDDLFRSGTRVVMHNSPYDIGWLGCYGVAPPDNLEDTLAACVQLDETHYKYSLDACCARAGIPGKDESLLRDAVEAFGGDRNKPKEHLWRLPAQYVGPYAEQDAVATLELWRQTEGALRAQDVWDAYKTETDLVPMTVAMRRRGVRIDTDLAERTKVEFRAASQTALEEIGELLGLGRAASMEEIRSPRQMEQWFSREKIGYPRTAKTGQGSFSAKWMKTHQHPLPRACVMASQFEEAAHKFIENFMLGFSVRGRIHAEIHQFLSDDGGTVSHRLSYSEPPLQQMTSPDKDPRDEQGQLIWEKAIGTKIRLCFLPEKGKLWLASDYSQQEPRLTVHFASVCNARGAQAAVDRYIDQPRTDYHRMVAEMTGKPRPVAKILNLAMTYGKGKHSTAEELGVELSEAERIIAEYHERLPFIKALEEIAKRRANDRGFIRLIDGARMHYNSWEGGWVDWDERRAAEAAGKRMTPCSREEALERQADPDHPWSKTRLRRADTRKALNNLIQGSAARQTKRAMREMWRAGYTPLLQMHDELDNDVDSPEQVREIERIMIETTPLVVPTVVDSEVGPNWGQAKMSWDECVAKYGMAA